MIYYINPTTGEVFAYETEAEREAFGQTGLVPMTPDEISAHLAPPPPAIPQSVTMRQARLALLDIGLLDDVDAAIAAIPDPVQRKAAEIEWEYATTVVRDSSWVQTLGASLNLTSAQIDELFIAAAKL